MQFIKKIKEAESNLKILKREKREAEIEWDRTEGDWERTKGEWERTKGEWERTKGQFTKEEIKNQKLI